MQGYRSLGYHLLHYYKRNLQDSHFVIILLQNETQNRAFAPWGEQ